MAERRGQAANRARPGEPHGGRHRGQRAPDLRVDRQGARGGRAAGRVSRADGHGLPGRGPVAEAALPRRGPAGPRRARLRGRGRSSRWSASRSATRPPTTPSPCWRTARSSAVYRKVLLPNYGVFDERRYFEPGDTPALIEVAGVRVGLTICEDIWYPGPPASVEALAGASLIVNPSASPVPPRQGRLSGADGRRSAPARPGRRSRSATWSVARTSWSSTATAWSSRRTARRWLAAPSSPRSSWSATWSSSRIRPPSGRRRSPSSSRRAGGRHRPPARPARGTRAERRACEPHLAEPLEPDAEVYEALKLGLARLRAQERLRAGAGRGLGRDRLGARRPDRRRRARARAGELRRHALPPLQRGDPGRRPGDRCATWAPS